MSFLDRIPPWSTCGVGSLPFDDPILAANHACVGYDVPFCPQLPRLEGDMVSEWLGSDTHLCGWSPERDRERPLAWDAFLTQVSKRPPGHRVVKLQVTGPATLACALERSTGAQATTSSTGSLALEISSWLAANVSGQLQTLTRRGLDVVLVVDEPALGVFGAAGAERIWDPLRAIAPAWGLHLCCTVPWDLVELTGPDLLSFDLAHEQLDRRATEALRRLCGRGTKIAWGAIASHRQEHAIQAVSRLRAIVSRIPGVDGSSIVTPSCGTGRISTGREYEVAAALSDVRRSMLRRHLPRERTAEVAHER